jgi:4-amino-4-deoxy-L-arabinose transferase-like glycosyltransferase
MIFVKLIKKNIGLILIFILAICLNFIYLGKRFDYNLYYAASVKSMLANPHNLFFASFDPAGFQTIDKPPVGFGLRLLVPVFLALENGVYYSHRH